MGFKEKTPSGRGFGFLIFEDFQGVGVLREVGIADGGQAELSETLWHSEAVAGAQRLVVMAANT